MSDLQDKLNVFTLIAKSPFTSRDAISKELRTLTKSPLVSSKQFNVVYTEFRELILAGDMPSNITDILKQNGKIVQYLKTPVNQMQNKNPKSKTKIKNENGKPAEGQKARAIEGGKELILDAESLLKELQNDKLIIELTSKYNTSARVVNNLVDNLKDQGYNITEINGIFRLSKEVIPTENIHEINWDGSQIIRFGVVSDTHLCNKHQQITFLKHLYSIFKKEGIEKVYHVGDISDGYYTNRSEQIYELFKHGVDDQAQYIIDNYPSDIKTDFIIGNHDVTHIRNGGANIGKMIQMQRSDMKYLGTLQATLNLTPNCKMELRHPLDGTSYSLSYKPQKYVESITGGEKPNILLIGHYHKQGYFFYRNIHTILVPSLEAQTAFMKGKGLASDVGGIIITVYIDKDGTIKRLLPEFIPLYKMLKEDY